jgi:hypothetical protein
MGAWERLVRVTKTCFSTNKGGIDGTGDALPGVPVPSCMVHQVFCGPCSTHSSTVGWSSVVAMASRESCRVQSRRAWYYMSKSRISLVLLRTVYTLYPQCLHVTHCSHVRVKSNLDEAPCRLVEYAQCCDDQNGEAKRWTGVRSCWGS